MSTSPVSPEDIRAAAEVHQELGPEYSDAVVAAFLDKVDKEVAARVEARLAESSRARLMRRGRRRTLAMGVAMGACAGALVTGISMAHFDHSEPAGSSGQSVSIPGPFVPRGQLPTFEPPDGQKVPNSLPRGALLPPPQFQAAPGK
jgi:hypothetical protein